MRSVEGVGIGSERDSVDDEDDQLLVEEMAAPVSVKGVRLWTSRQSWFTGNFRWRGLETSAY